jgi:hypothetical protein
MGIDMPLRPLFLFILAFVLGSMIATAQGDDFRVENEVFTGRDKKPVAETLTLFSGDFVYDFVVGDQAKGIESKEVTVFDIRRGRITLLDSSRKVQTSLTTKELQQLTDAFRKMAANEPNGDLIIPEFLVAFDEAERRITLTSNALTYRVKGFSPKDPTAAKRYSNFADWYARLNAIIGNLPPFGRIELNRRMAENGLMPARIERTIVLNRKQTVAHSEHSVLWTLSNTDGRRIKHAGEMMSNLRKVSMKEYWRIKDQVVAK